MYLFVLPALILSISVIIVPAILTVVVSFTEWDGINLPEFVGLDNFRELFEDGDIFQVIYHNVIWTVIFLTIPVMISLMYSVFLLRAKRGQALFQIVFLIPYIMAPIINAIIWQKVIYNPINGILAFLNNSYNLNLTSPFANADIALYGVASVDIWHFWGFLTIIFYSAMRQTPFDQIEAAKMEGANLWQIFRYIILPSIKATIILMLVLILIWSFLTFDYIYLLTQGGPAGSTEMLSTFAYSLAFSSFEVGKASAVALIISGFGLLATSLFLWVNRRGG